MSTCLSAKTHSKLGWRRVRGFSFAESCDSVPLSTTEIARAAQSFPIVFETNGKEWTTVAVLGLHKGVNHCVSRQGHWIPEYVPALLRAYPFRLGAEDEHLELWPGYVPEPLDAREIEPFFVEEQPAALVQRTHAFLRSVHVGIKAASAPLRFLEDKGLLRPVEISGLTHDPDRTFMLDGPAFEKLPDETWLRLRRHGIMSWLYAHIASLQHFDRIKKMADLLSQEHVTAYRSPDDGHDINGFFDAISRDESR